MAALARVTAEGPRFTGPPRRRLPPFRPGIIARVSTRDGSCVSGAEGVTGFLDIMKRVKVDLLPICSYCKRIREGEDYTRSVEAYFAEHHDTQFTHGVCPDCYEKHVRLQLEKL